MKLINTNINNTINEAYLVETLNLNNKTILELGCGAATMTKKIASTGFDRKVIACEVDETQHSKNLSLNIDNIEFKLCGAQKISLENESVDMVFMFKSFHHIPLNLMKDSLIEIKRVLKPNGLIYISEPLFYGDQNELIAVFHDEKLVREKAFEAIENSVKNEEFKLFQEIFFNTEVSYDSFENFKTKQMDVTYNEPISNKSILEKTKEKYDSFSTNGKCEFLKPFRVDILQKI